MWQSADDIAEIGTRVQCDMGVYYRLTRDPAVFVEAWQTDDGETFTLDGVTVRKVA